MKYKISIRDHALKDLKKVDDRQARIIIKKIDSLKDNPKRANTNKLKGTLKEYYRLRVGSYRILYQIDNAGKEVIINRIMHRKDSYRN